MSECELVSTKKKKKKKNTQAGNEWFNILPKYSQARKKPPPTSPARTLTRLQACTTHSHIRAWQRERETERDRERELSTHCDRFCSFLRNITILCLRVLRLSHIRKWTFGMHNISIHPNPPTPPPKKKKKKKRQSAEGIARNRPAKV